MEHGADDPYTAGLADVISRIREELEDAQRRGAGSPIRFGVEKVSLEFTVQVRREGRGRAGLRIGVVTAEAGGTLSRDNTHRIQVELQPHGEDGSKMDVGR
ncbi:trypco2 family protein [Streptomyces spinosus]|uniref:trypco2 family protein n=1 Tax=Streptomyces spinosus TaxID=2872623 RepID=UPI001CEDE464|nr:trypco2 family protein [Streptomyces spinosus]